ncbi:arylesterase [Aestuariirhabdus litorea]|uniref:Arylesterase n=1 Tax=Aestuariirhabdus litorea TaxID=2528527 RepID=A0A3P3VUS2_9GAMM|nr:arylesterase [Aestuariirhabdus litorea]RRJ85376.1 arylesterase [Aestuariirhabdus litorea]RWW98600.1 arylesterase [Endozoicomonadaceae bacterium GTF-13]
MHLSIRLLTGLVIVLLSLGRPALASAETLLVLGDSLSAGYGIQQELGWVSLLEKKLQRQNSAFEVVNASVSGETTAGGLQRLPSALERHSPRWVLVELGANDGLRGGNINSMRNNLAAILEQVKRAGAQPILFEMMLPPNYGATYTRLFQQSFSDLASRHDVPLVPFFLADVANEPHLLQEDRMHPTEAAQPLILDRVWPVLEPLLNN